MSEGAVQRRLAAILAADVVGYSRLMGLDEAGTLSALKALRAGLIDLKIDEHSGRIFKATGDGVLAEFSSVVNAVVCAIDIQRGMQLRHGGRPDDRRISLRIGVNLGDVIVEGDDIFGEGVNVAARLEGLASPGGVAISAAVRDQIGNRLDLQFDDMGDQALKNIERPVRVYAVRPDSEAPAQRTVLALPSKPSIAVLPFENLSGDPEQEYFADGIVEEIITALSRFRSLFVIARNSSFTYKGRAVDVKQVGRELGVRYVLEGSVRKSGTKVRIAGQLIDTSTGAHLWADRVDGGLEDIFDLQDQVTASVVGAIAPKLEQAEIERSSSKPTESLGAYDYYLRGLAAMHLWTREGNGEALAHFIRAIELDVGFAAAYGMAARCYSQRKAGGWATDRVHDIAETARLARRAAELGKDDAVALCTAGYSLAFVVGDFDDGAAMIDRALALNPNLAWAWTHSAWVSFWRSEPEVVIESAARALRLSPQDPQIFSTQCAIACAHYLAGRYADALSWGEAAVRRQPNFGPALRVVAASSAMAGQQELAQKAMAHLRGFYPELRISNLEDLSPPGEKNLAAWADGLRKAGLPE